MLCDFSDFTIVVSHRRHIMEQLSEVLAALAVDPSELAGGNAPLDHTAPLTGWPYENEDSENEYWCDT
jgi:hypothetical protein